MSAVAFDDELLMIFSPDLSCTYLLDQFYYAISPRIGRVRASE